MRIAYVGDFVEYPFQNSSEFCDLVWLIGYIFDVVSGLVKNWVGVFPLFQKCKSSLLSSIINQMDGLELF